MKETTSYHVTVEGTAWGGFQAEMTYNFDELPTKEQLYDRCGDFQNCAIVDVVKVTTKYEYGYPGLEYIDTIK